MTNFRRATADDAHDLAPRLRQVDLAELMRDEDSDPLKVLLFAVEQTECWAFAEPSGLVYSLGGVRAMEDGGGLVWQLGSDEMSRNRKDFLRITKEVTGGYKTRFELLHNYVGAANIEAKRHLRYLGFRVEPDIVLAGTRQVPFQYFWWKRGF